jgi:RNA polymerase sigma-70 factor (ECF subfamily)
MLKITHLADQDSIDTFKLEGKLLEPWIGEVMRVCAGRNGQSGRTRLDLSGLLFVDQAGARLLKDLIRSGAIVSGCSGFVAELLHLEEYMTATTMNRFILEGSFTPQPSCEQETEARLVAAIRAGDEEASAAFVRKFGGRMLAVARRILRCEEDSADAVQDAFLSAFRSLEHFEGYSSLGTWLHRIVVNACLMKLRAQSRDRCVPINELLPTFDETGHHSRPVRPWEEQTLSKLTREETRNQVRACIERLPEPYRTVILLRDIQELDTEQTAQLLGIAPGAVKTRLHRARQALRTLLEPFFRAEELSF